jgi:hypothetical protein
VKSRPKQWALQNYDADCVFEQWITLNGSVATVQNRLINGRSDTTQYQAMDQELGALYTWRALSQLWTYSGTQPFTGGALTQIPKTAPPWAYFRATEGWAAYTMSTGSKWGAQRGGQHAQQGGSANFVDEDGDGVCDNCVNGGVPAQDGTGRMMRQGRNR